MIPLLLFTASCLGASPFSAANSTFYRHDTGQVSTRISQAAGNVAPAKISAVSKKWKLSHKEWLS